MRKKVVASFFVFACALACFAAGVSESNLCPPKAMADIIVQESVPVTVKGYNLDPSNPYNPPVSGLAHGLVAKGATYSVYVPEGQQPWSPGVMILIPDGMTAKQFAESEVGRQWMTACDKNLFSVGFLEPSRGKWNVTGSASQRDDVQAVVDVYTQMRSKSQDLYLPFTMDKSRVSLVGYEEGGAMALAAAAGFPSAFSGVVAIDAVGTDAEFINALGETYCFPFPADGLKAKEEVKLVSNTLAMPVWFINSMDKAAFEYYRGINNATKVDQNSVAATFSNPSDPVQAVWVSNSSLNMNPVVLWTNFLSKHTRPLGVEGGHLGYAMNFETRADGTGFVLSEQVVDGFPRRWLTYVPTSYNPENKVPLVTVLHGYTASMYALAEESRWSDIAEEHGFIVVFAQAYPNVLEGRPNIPAPAWISPNLFKGDSTNTDDIAFLSEVIDITKRNYAIDEGRVFGTGHSNGCAMTLALASSRPELYTAIAPIGYAAPGISESLSTLMPTWLFIGEFDGAGMKIQEGNGLDKTLDYWTSVNGLDRDNFTVADSANGRFTTMTWTDSTYKPLVRFSGVNTSAHSYFPEESELIWNEFFSRYSKVDGVHYYDGEALNTPIAKPVTEIAPNSYCISEHLLVNSFLVVGETSAAVIDTGIGTGNLMDEVRAITDLPVEVLLTHGHMDHSGGMYSFETCWLNSLDAATAMRGFLNTEGRKGYISSRVPQRFPGVGHSEYVSSLVPDKIEGEFNYKPITEGQVWDLGGVKLEAIFTPGHSAGSVCFLDSKNRILYSGDTVNKSVCIFNNPLATENLVTLRDTMNKLWARESEYDLLAIGHDGTVIDKGIILDYLTMCNGLIDGTLVGNYEEVGIRAGLVLREGAAEFWYLADR